MLRRAAPRPKGAHGGDIGLVALLVGAVGLGGQLDEGMQRHLHPGRALLGHVHEVSVDAAQHGLVGDDDDVLGPLELHDDGLEPDHEVAVRLAAAVAVVVLVVVARPEVVRVARLDVLVREPVAHARVQLVQRLPLELLVALGQEPRRLDRALERRRPDRELAVVADGFPD